MIARVGAIGIELASLSSTEASLKVLKLGLSTKSEGRGLTLRLNTTSMAL